MISLTTNAIPQHSPTTSPGANTSSSHSSSSSTSLSSSSHQSNSHFGNSGWRHNTSGASSSNTSPPAHVPNSSSPSNSFTSRHCPPPCQQYNMHAHPSAVGSARSSHGHVAVASPTALVGGPSSGAHVEDSHQSSTTGSLRGGSGSSTFSADAHQSTSGVVGSQSSPSRHRQALQESGHSRRTTSEGVPLPSPRTTHSPSSRYAARMEQSELPVQHDGGHSGTGTAMAVNTTRYARPSASVSMPSTMSERPQLNLTTYPTQDLLRVLATLLAQIATANDELRPVVPSPAATPGKSRKGEGEGEVDANGLSAGSINDTASGAKSLARRTRKTPTTAALGALNTPSSTLCFHARNVPSISIESYLLRILKYCPTTNEVFLSLLVYFDRMSRMSGAAARGPEEGRRRGKDGSGGRRQKSDNQRGADEGEMDADADRRRQDRRLPRMPASQMDTAASSHHGQFSRSLNGSTSADDDDVQMRTEDDDSGAEDEDEETYPGMRGFAIDSYNVHRLVIAGVTVASKFFSDVFYTNSRYAKVGGLPVHELNQLELQFLLLNNFNLVIPLDEMQRYADQLLVYGSGTSEPAAKDVKMATD